MDSQATRTLRLYVTQINKLLSTRFVSSGAHVQLKIGFEEGNPLEINNSVPNENELGEFLLAFRLIYLQGEDTNFFHVANTVYKILDEKDHDHPYKKGLAQARKSFNDTLDKPGMPFSYNGEQIVPRKLIDLWFNAYYFHLSSDKIPEFERLRDGMGPFFQFLFIDALISLTECVIWLGQLANDLVAQATPDAPDE